MKTLYITDLDGTLLTADEKISPYSADTINRLIDKGMLFSFATARPYVTAGRVTACLSRHFPVILYNGAFILDNSSGRLIKTNFMPPEVSHKVLDILAGGDVYPIVYHYTDGRENISWVTDKACSEMQDFIDNRQGPVPRMPVQEKSGLYHRDIYYMSCIDSAEKLYPLYLALKDNPDINVIYQTDIYSGRQWLDIMSHATSKANAVLQLKEQLGCDRVVCFGDGKNDLSMFSIADECYAVENAVDELKAAATGVIGPNNRDGVARWLAENAVW